MQEFDYEIECIKEKHNFFADSLSRKEKEVHKISSAIVKKLLPISTVKVSEKELKGLRESYKKDQFFNKYWENPVEPFINKGSRLFMNGKLCIPKGFFREMILKSHHESVHGAHRGFGKTKEKLQEYFYLPKMKEETKIFVHSCHECQKSKYLNKRIGAINPFPPPKKKWEEISMDFSFDLSSTKDQYTGILVVVDKLSKLPILYH